MRLERLSREAHAHLRLNQTTDLSYAGNTHLVDLAAVEFVQAAADFPVVFVDEDGMTPKGLLGLQDGVNSFVGADGRWREPAYVPGVIRMYPFLLSDDGDGDIGVYVDLDFAGWDTRHGKRLFEDDGSDAPYLHEVMEFLRGSAVEEGRTRDLVRELERLELLAPATMTFRHPERTFTVDGLWTVDEERLQALPYTELALLHSKGYLAWIHAHLVSLHQGTKLLYRLMGD